MAFEMVAQQALVKVRDLLGWDVSRWDRHDPHASVSCLAFHRSQLLLSQKKADEDEISRPVHDKESSLPEVAVTAFLMRWTAKDGSRSPYKMKGGFVRYHSASMGNAIRTLQFLKYYF